jgi:hypothetical protein
MLLPLPHGWDSLPHPWQLLPGSEEKTEVKHKKNKNSRIIYPAMAAGSSSVMRGRLLWLCRPADTEDRLPQGTGKK